MNANDVQALKKQYGSDIFDLANALHQEMNKLLKVYSI